MDSLALEKKAFFEKQPVSHETALKFERYAALLVDANAQFNLVAASTIPSLWLRHFWDSAQLAALIPTSAHCLVDLGSGAGFPGLVLALLQPGLDVHLVESVGKKARFLEAVAHELTPNVTVHNARAESLAGLKADVVTARAVTALPLLLSLAKPFLEKDGICLFLKGEKADAELTEARKYWTFKVDKKVSQSDPSGTILAFSDLKVLRKNDEHRRKYGR